MDFGSIKEMYEQQREYFFSQETKPYEHRILILKELKYRIETYETRMIEAMQIDMAKPTIEAAGGEIWYVLEEIEYAMRRLKRWMRPHRVPTPLLHFRASSFIYPEPYGQVLIMAPWNYPFNLLFSPLVGALAAGNTAILKPSELAPATAQVMEEMINQHFDSKILRVINGGVETAQDLLKIPFDYIFFTGGTKVGKLVMKAAADHLTPVTLELGGKSPAIVDETADLDVAASRIVWGKFFNAGQTCIAPDYVLAQEIIYSDLIHRLKEKIIDYYGIEPQKSADFARIINDKHFSRLQNLINPEKVVHGGQVESSTRYIAPTILEKVDLDDAVMNEEIFGPILPVLMYRNFEQAFDIIQKHPNPLALYLFTRNKNTEKRVISEVPYGGGCINDVISHNFNEMLPFGGRETSGMGAYHGEYSFNTFSHDKSILHRKNWPDFSIRYPPHKVENRLMRVFFKIASWLI